jgi:hypothetical protein
MYNETNSTNIQCDRLAQAGFIYRNTDDTPA